MSKPIRSITIVGGGTSGWLAALFFVTRFQADVDSGAMKVTLVESPRIPIIGVGESLSPSMPGTLQSLNVDENAFIRETDATFKLAGYFLDWEKPVGGQVSSWVNPFVAYTTGGMEFERFEVGRTDVAEPVDYARTISPCRDAIERGVGPRRPGQGSYEAVLRYAYHTDATKFAPFLRDVAIGRGVTQILDEVQECELDEKGFVSALKLEERGRLPVELVIDATGFAGVVINKALGVPIIDYSRYLINDRAVVQPLKHSDERGEIEPATRSTALSSGWSFRVPLFSRTGNGYVYSSAFISDDQAKAELAKSVAGIDEAACRSVRINVGRPRDSWVKNCVAIGLSAGFVEPLEASAIYSVETSLKWLFHYFPDSDYAPALMRRYNDRTAGLYDEVVDYILLHYILSDRDDSPYWRAQRLEVKPTDRLAYNLEVWRSCLPIRGDFPAVNYFDEVTYTAALLGKRFYRGGTIHPERTLSRQAWEKTKRELATMHSRALAALPGHRALLEHIRAS